MIRRHPLDYSAPRISDLPEPEKYAALIARHDQARLAWMESRRPRRLADRFLSFLRGTPHHEEAAGGSAPPPAGRRVISEAA